MPKLNWKHNEQYKSTIAYVEHLDGVLVRVEYIPSKRTWEFQLLNRLRVVTRDKPETAIEEIKEIAEAMVYGLIKGLNREILTKIEGS